jgi:hypothetical protein
MRRVEDSPIDPEVAASLDAIDATLAGEPVDPKYADLAELALLLSAARPQCSDEFAAAMDARVVRRFTAPRPAAPAQAGGSSRSRRRWLLSPAWGSGIAAGAIAVVVAVVVASGGSGGGSSTSSNDFTEGTPALTSSSAASAPSAHAPSAAASSHGSAAGVPARLLARGTSATAQSASIPNAPAFSPANAGALTSAPTPQSNGRKVVQSAQLALNARPVRIDAVAQELFDVVGAQHGIVNHSSVTASGGPGAFAQFQLSVPSANLSQTMTELSRLQYASVSSRTDNTQDVNNQYVGDLRALADAKALRTALLKRLAQAVTTEQIDSLNQQIHDADAQISSEESTLNSLNHQVNYSQIQVTINSAPPVPVAHHSSGFTVGKAAHDAGRVLTVAAGVALITLAALVPIGLLLALGLWFTTSVRRRRREQALDLA